VCFYCFSQSLGSDLFIEETKIAKNGFCLQCGSVLECQPLITNEEFVELRQEFMNKALIRHGNVFVQSSPEELFAFRQFLEQHRSRPFTVAFDGLNIAGISGNVGSPKIGSRMVSEPYRAVQFVP